MSATKQLGLEQIDLRFSSLRLSNPLDLQRLQASITSEGIRDPVLVSTGVEPGYSVLVDGFKRVHVAKKLELSHVWAQEVQLDVTHAKTAILQYNQPRLGLCKLEEAWIVRSLCDQGLTQTEVAALLRRDKSWVCRRLRIATKLDKRLQEDVKRGSLSATVACELSQLQRCNDQLGVAQAASEHHLSSREITRLVKKLRNAKQPAAREILDHPLRYIDAGNETQNASRSDPDLSEGGNRLRCCLLSWQNACVRLTRALDRACVADVHALALLLHDAQAIAMQTLRQLETIHRAEDAQLTLTQGEVPTVSAPP
jgi:ParB-like chromosome segregation protein Spo0J